MKKKKAHPDEPDFRTARGWWPDLPDIRTTVALGAILMGFGGAEAIGVRAAEPAAATVTASKEFPPNVWVEVAREAIAPSWSGMIYDPVRGQVLHWGGPIHPAKWWKYNCAQVARGRGQCKYATTIPV